MTELGTHDQMLKGSTPAISKPSDVLQELYIKNVQDDLSLADEYIIEKGRSLEIHRIYFRFIHCLLAYKFRSICILQDKLSWNGESPLYYTFKYNIVLQISIVSSTKLQDFD
jgi:hypothetical protein